MEIPLDEREFCKFGLPGPSDPSAGHQFIDKQDDRYHQDDVYYSPNVRKGEKSDQPSYDQDYDDYPYNVPHDFYGLDYFVQYSKKHDLDLAVRTYNR